MSGECITRDEYEGRERLCDERFARDKKQIEQCEKLVHEIQLLNVKMSEMIERHDRELAAQDKRLHELEDKPADTFGKLKIAFATAIISGIAGYVVSAIVAATK